MVKNRTKKVVFRAREEEFKAIKSAAARTGLTASEWMRESLLKLIKKS